MDRIKTAVEGLQSRQRRYKAVRAANMAVYAAAVALFFFPDLRLAGLALMAAGLLLHFLVSRRLTGAYKAEAIQANLRFGLCAGMAGFTYDPKGGMSYSGFRDWALAPIRGEERSLLCRNAFTAKDGKLSLTGQEATFHYEAPGQGRGGIRFLSGTLLTAGSPAGKGWLLVRPDVLNAGALAAFAQEHGYEPAPNAPEGWTLYRQEGAPELPEGVLRRVKDQPATVSILRLTDRGAAAFLNGRFYTGLKYPSIQPTEQLLRENTLAERDSLLALFRQWCGRK